MTPNELKDKLAMFYLTAKSEGYDREPIECVTGSGGRSFRPHTIQANVGDPSRPIGASSFAANPGEVWNDVCSIVEHLAGDGIDETGRYVLMQWLSPAEAAIFAGFFESEEDVEAICLSSTKDMTYDPNGEPSDNQDFFEWNFQISGYFRPVTAKVKQDLNDCSQLTLMLIPNNGEETNETNI